MNLRKKNNNKKTPRRKKKSDLWFPEGERKMRGRRRKTKKVQSPRYKVISTRDEMYSMMTIANTALR